MAVRCGQSLVATLLFLIGCADNPPAVIENKSVAAVDVPRSFECGCRSVC